ncbi:hypothetical protein THOM_2692, partial [Trachipleistophora hominis]
VLNLEYKPFKEVEGKNRESRHCRRSLRLYNIRLSSH